MDTATEFNEFFINKIEKLKDNISDDLKVDPVVNLKAKMAKKNLTFALKTVSENTVKKGMKKMKNKKSSGSDGIPQDCLLMGASVLVTPITHIILTDCVDTVLLPFTFHCSHLKKYPA